MIMTDNVLYYLEPALFFIIGCCLGSFATFMGHRIFSENLSVLGKRSICTSCNKILPKKALFPLFSYIFCKGKCLMCNAKISIRYPIIEFIAGLGSLYAFISWGQSFKTVVIVVLITCFMIQIVSDIEYYMASDSVDIVMLIMVIMLGIIEHKKILDQLIFFIGGALFMLCCRQIVMWWIGKDPLGLGDVKVVAILAPLANSALELVIIFGLFGIFGLIFGVLWKKQTKSEIFPYLPPILMAFSIDYFFLAKYMTFFLQKT